MRELNVGKKKIPPLTQLKDDELHFRSSTRQFAETNVNPLVKEMDHEAKLNERLIHQIFKQGLMGIDIPGEYGGKDGSFFMTILAIEELASIDPSVSVFIDVQNTLVNNTIFRWGSDEQKQRYLPLLTQNTIGAFSLTEEEAGSDAYAMSCKAEKVKGGYKLTGQKIWVTNSAEASVIILFAKVVSNGNKEGITAFLIDRERSQGLIVRERDQKLGIRASSTCSISLENVFVPEENILGGIGQGEQIAIETLSDGRIGIGAQMLGLAQGSLNIALDHAQKRKQFGREIASFQGVHFNLAEMATKVEATRLLVYNAARIKEMQNFSIERFTSASMAKLYAARVAEEVTSKAIDILGGIGFMQGSPIEKFYRDAKIGSIYEGTTNMQLRSIAKAIMKI